MRRSSCVAIILILTSLLFLPAAAWGQEPPPPEKPAEKSGPQLPEAPKPQPPASRLAEQHRFWDRRNAWLFSGVAAARALDYHSTGNMRRRGRDEILLTNEVVDNKPAFVAIEAAATLTSVGVSYLFHRAGHHKLERWTSYLHISVGAGGAIRNYSLKSHPLPPAR